MTADEMKAKDIIDGLNLSGGFKKRLEISIKDYARQKCKEQRELCSNIGGFSFDTHCRIQDAPEPEMD